MGRVVAIRCKASSKQNFGDVESVSDNVKCGVKGQSGVSDGEAEKIELPLIEMGKLREKFTPGVGESK